MFHTQDPKAFGQYLKTLRKHLKLTQEVVRLTCGINEDTLRKIESGLVIPRFETLASLSRLYRIDLPARFSRFYASDELLQLYEDCDEALQQFDLVRLKALCEEASHPKNREAIASTLINPLEYDQFLIFSKAAILSLEGAFDQFPSQLICLEEGLRLSQPRFSLNTWHKLHYNALEIRLLVLYARILTQLRQNRLSIEILNYLLPQLEYLFAHDAVTSSYWAKLHFNLAYNHHILDEHEKVIEHANAGIESAKPHGQFRDLHGLYFRKFVAEHNLGLPEALSSLAKSLAIIDLLDLPKLKEAYIRSAHQQYGVDGELLQRLQLYAK